MKPQRLEGLVNYALELAFSPVGCEEEMKHFLARRDLV